MRGRHQLFMPMTDLNFSLTALFAASVVSLLVTPGPVTLLVLRAGLAGGMRHALQTIAGTNAASLVLIAVSTLLIKGLLVMDDAVMVGIRLLGCAYIGTIAWGMVREALQMPQTAASAGGQASTGLVAAPAGFVRGFALGISNPKDIIFFASFLPQFMGVLPSPDHSIALLTGLWIVLDFSTLLLLTLLVRKLVRPALQRSLLLVAAVLLLVIGVGGLVHALHGMLWG